MEQAELAQGSLPQPGRAWIQAVPSQQGPRSPSLPAAAYGIVALLAAVAYSFLVSALIAANGRQSALARAVARNVKGRISLLMYAGGVAGAFVAP